MASEYEFHKKEYSLMPITNVVMDYRGKRKEKQEQKQTNKKKTVDKRFLPREQSESLLKYLSLLPGQRVFIKSALQVFIIAVTLPPFTSPNETFSEVSSPPCFRKDISLVFFHLLSEQDVIPNKEDCTTPTKPTWTLNWIFPG